MAEDRPQAWVDQLDCPHASPAFSSEEAAAAAAALAKAAHDFVPDSHNFNKFHALAEDFLGYAAAASMPEATRAKYPIRLPAWSDRLRREYASATGLQSEATRMAQARARLLGHGGVPTAEEFQATAAVATSLGALNPALARGQRPPAAGAANPRSNPRRRRGRNRHQQQQQGPRAQTPGGGRGR
jgi:hypothetical protein